MKILISAGHTLRGKGTGAVGYINESNENRILAKKVVAYLKMAGHEVDYYEVNQANDYLYQQTNFANKKDYDLVVQIHFNAGDGIGTETLYSSSRGKIWADRITNSLGEMYKQRGSKIRNNLHWLNKTKAAAILIETCFVDSKIDTDIYIINKDLTAKLIAEGINQKSITDSNDTNVAKPICKFKNGDYSGRKARVTANVLNVRYDRGTDYKVIDKLKKGQIVNLNYCIDDWISIDGFKGNKGLGYVHTDYLELL